VVSGVSGWMGALDRGPCASKGIGGFGHFCPIGLNGVFSSRNVFDLCMES